MAKGIVALLPSTDLPETFFLLGSSSTLVRDLLQNPGIPDPISSSTSRKYLLRRRQKQPTVSIATLGPAARLQLRLRSWYPGISGLFHSVDLWDSSSLRSYPYSTQIIPACVFRYHSHSYSLFQIFQTQGMNSGLLHLQADSSPSEPPGKPQMLCTTAQILPIRVYVLTGTRDATHTLK